jgi:hypothetical protein
MGCLLGVLFSNEPNYCRISRSHAFGYEVVVVLWNITPCSSLEVGRWRKYVLPKMSVNF